jgi:polyphosphate glucokinase
MSHFLGIDIGGSGIKGALVDMLTGELVSDRVRVETPQPSLPHAVAEAVNLLVTGADYDGPIGCTFPAIVKRGVMHSAANVDKSWIGTDGRALFEQQTGMPVAVLNDADAAGLAEMAFGAGQGHDGTVIMLTFGTGIGSAVFLDGKLVPNTEFGHLQIHGKIAEARCSSRVKELKDMSYAKWAKRVNEYLMHLEFIFSPDLFIIGGGISKRYEKYFKYFTLNTEIVPARYFNDAGIVGAAMAAAQEFHTEPLRTPQPRVPADDYIELGNPAKKSSADDDVPF